MSPREIPSVHREICELIPWIVNGTAAPADQRRAEVHLAECEDCRAELDFQQRVSQVVRGQPGPAIDAQGALRSFRTGPRHTGARGLPHRALQPGLVAAVIIEGIALCVLGAALLARTSPDAEYRTLTVASPLPAASIRVVFAPDLTTRAMQQILEDAHLHVVDGPSRSRVFLLAPDGQVRVPAADTTLARLRASPGVVFAEPASAARP